ncbi:hypothetical protein BJX70DRAFT_291142 [Aspergillus crustosus]
MYSVSKHRGYFILAILTNGTIALDWTSLDGRRFESNRFQSRSDGNFDLGMFGVYCRKIDVKLQHQSTRLTANLNLNLNLNLNPGPWNFPVWGRLEAGEAILRTRVAPSTE